MAALEKFMFEYDFDAENAPPVNPAPETTAGNEPEAPAEPEEPPARHTDADLEAARAESYQAGQDAGQKQGYEQGRKDAHTDAEKAAQNALAQVAKGLNNLCRDLDATEARRASEARDLALTIVRRLFPSLQRQNGMNEIETLITETLSRLRHHPKVVIRGAPATIARISDRQEALAAQTGFEGKLRLLEDEAISQADIRVEWSDGGVHRDTEGLWREIETALRDAFGEEAASLAGSEPGSPPRNDASDETNASAQSNSPCRVNDGENDTQADTQSSGSPDGRESAETVRSTA